MRMTGSRLLAAGMVWIGIGIVCGSLQAQQSPEGGREREQKVSIDAKKTTLLTVVEQLMKQVHGNYTLDSQLQDAPIGAIHLTGVPFRTALEVALKAGGKPATYRLEAGVYMVVARTQETQPAPSVTQESQQEEPRVSIVDGQGEENPRIALSVENANLYDTLKAVFKHTRAQYSLDPSLRNVFVTVNINQPLRSALDTLLRASGQPLTYQLENNVYSIVPKTDGDQAVDDANGQSAETRLVKMELDNADLFTALKLLFAQTKMQYSLDPALKNIFVNIHINQPFPRALESVLRAAGQNVTYKLENGVYSITTRP